jgi:hypothetical protein
MAGAPFMGSMNAVILFSLFQFLFSDLHSVCGGGRSCAAIAIDDLGSRLTHACPPLLGVTTKGQLFARLPTDHTRKLCSLLCKPKSGARKLNPPLRPKSICFNIKFCTTDIYPSRSLSFTPFHFFLFHTLFRNGSHTTLLESIRFTRFPSQRGVPQVVPLSRSYSFP